MNWWEREPPESTEEQKRFNKACQAYEERFGERFCFQMGIDGGTIEETIEEIYRYIETGKKKEEKPYKKGVLY